MKKTLLIMVMALAVLLTQCRKPEVKFPSPVAPEGTTVSMTVTAGPGSKTDITTAGGITWSTGDRIYVGHNNAYIGYLTIVSGDGTPTGTFSGDVMLPTGTTGDQTFHFFYLGNAKDYSKELTKGESATVAVSFAEQNIYNNDGNLENASAQHVGYGTASGTVKDGVVTGINVTLVSKVALARFSFKKGGADYTGALTLSGANIYNSMTVGFNGSFNHGATAGNITLTAGYGERYVMLVPTGDATEQTLTFAGGSEVGGGKVPGLQSNKFYGKSDAIAVSLHETVNFGTPNLNWSVCNLGATNGATAESWYGDYYAWGATETWYSAGGQTSSPTWKSGYSDGYTWRHYPGNGGKYSYNATEIAAWDNSNLTNNVLKSGVDAATVAWGSGWRMPTREEWQLLYDNNTFEWLAAGVTSTKVTSFTAVAAGYLVVKGGKNSIASDAAVYMFLPANGWRGNTDFNSPGEDGAYWSVERGEAVSQGKSFGCGINCSPGVGAYYRQFGLAVRPVL